MTAAWLALAAFVGGGGWYAHVRLFKRKRMTLAVRMRAEGKSTRAIAAELAVSHQTVMRDLALWNERQSARVVQNVVRFPGPSHPAGGNLDHSGGPVSGPVKTTGEALGLTPGEERIARAVAFLTERGA